MRATMISARRQQRQNLKPLEGGLSWLALLSIPKAYIDEKWNIKHESKQCSSSSSSLSEDFDFEIESLISSLIRHNQNYRAIMTVMAY
jgi:hypothetical protein